MLLIGKQWSEVIANDFYAKCFWSFGSVIRKMSRLTSSSCWICQVRGWMGSSWRGQCGCVATCNLLLLITYSCSVLENDPTHTLRLTPMSPYYTEILQDDRRFSFMLSKTAEAASPHKRMCSVLAGKTGGTIHRCRSAADNHLWLSASLLLVSPSASDNQVSLNGWMTEQMGRWMNDRLNEANNKGWSGILVNGALSGGAVRHRSPVSWEVRGQPWIKNVDSL